MGLCGPWHPDPLQVSASAVGGAGLFFCMRCTLANISSPHLIRPGPPNDCRPIQSTLGRAFKVSTRHPDPLEMLLAGLDQPKLKTRGRH